MHTPALWTLAVYQSFFALSLGLLAMAAFEIKRFSRFHWCPPRSSLVCLGLLVLAMASTGWRAHERRTRVLPAAWEGVTLSLEGRIDDLPHATPQGWRLTLAVMQAAAAPLPAAPHPRSLTLPAPSDALLEVPQRVALHWPVSPESSSPMPQAGEVWRMRVRLRQPHGLHNPGGSDPELWWWNQDIGATGSIRINRDDPAPQRLQAASPWDMVVWRDRVRKAIESTVTEARIGGVLTALVVGDQRAIHSSDWDIFRTTGVAHLMSISGLHITLWAWLATGLMRRVWRLAPLCAPDWGSRLLLAVPVPVAAGWGGLLLAGLYAAFSGWGVPAQRTIWMLALVVVLRLQGRHWPWPTLGAAAMTVVLLCDPWAWMQPGFWLSFFAVAILIMTDTAERSAPAVQGRWWQGLGRAVWRLLREQSVMSVALAPLTLLCFGQFSVVGVVANLIAVPWVTLLVTPLGFAGLLWPACWSAAAWCLAQLHTGLSWLASWPWATWSSPQLPWPYALAPVVGAAVLVMPYGTWRWRCWCLPLLWPLWGWNPSRPLDGEFELMAADVGQGSAVLIRTAHSSLLYDTGPWWSADSDAGQRVLVPLLRSLGEQPSRIILSHSDSDHVGGAAAVLGMVESYQKHIKPEVFASFSPSTLATPLPASAAALRWQRCQAGQVWMQDGVRFELLHPTPTLYEREPPLPTNDLSCVLWVQGRQGSVLLTGDLSARFEAQLVRAYPQLRATVLLAPHHGSKTSSSLAFLQTVQPQWVFIQAGYRNRYQHPAPAVMARYEALGLQTKATASCGAIRWQSTDAAPSCYRAQVRHHWHWQAPVAPTTPQAEETDF
jgi:competence protein ComEC